MQPADAAALEWFFGPGQSVFSRSTTGAMLERAELFGVRMPVSTDMWQQLQDRRPNEPPPNALTVRKTGSTAQTWGYTHDEDALRRFARVDRVLGTMPGWAVGVLRGYHGDDGSRCAGSKHGRILAVVLLTRAGRRLLEQSSGSARKRGVTDLGLPPLDRLLNEVTLESVRSQAGRRRLLDAALRDAWTGYRSACRLWVEAAHVTIPSHDHRRRRQAAGVEHS